MFDGTRDLLGDALVDLMHEKPFAAITVQQVIDRADVGRSTFYTAICTYYLIPGELASAGFSSSAWILPSSSA